MNKIFLFAFIVFVTNAKAQITLEHTYDSAATWNTCSGNSNQLMIVKFEVSGEQYVKINRCGKMIGIYDMNHALIKNISLAGVPMNFQNIVGDVLYLSEKLFNTDTKKEFMYCYTYTDNFGNGQNVTNIYNEDGMLIFADTSSPLIRINVPLQQYPIYNTSFGTKMILSCTNGQARVFSLVGTLSTAIQTANENLVQQRSLISNPYPNPTNQFTTVDYKLPDNINQGEIVFYNLQGLEIKRFIVDRAFNSLLISTTDISAGTYYYQLQTTTNNSAGKKLVVVK